MAHPQSKVNGTESQPHLQLCLKALKMLHMAEGAFRERTMDDGMLEFLVGKCSLGDERLKSLLREQFELAIEAHRNGNPRYWKLTAGSLCRLAILNLEADAEVKARASGIRRANRKSLSLL